VLEEIISIYQTYGEDGNRRSQHQMQGSTQGNARPELSTRVYKNRRLKHVAKKGSVGRCQANKGTLNQVNQKNATILGKVRRQACGTSARAARKEDSVMNERGRRPRNPGNGEER